MRKALLISCAVLILCGLSPLLLLHEPFAVGFLQWATAAFTDYRLELKNPALDLRRGVASADEIHLYPVERDSQALVSVLDFEGQAPLSDLLGRTLRTGELEASAVLLYVTPGEGASNPRPIDWLKHFRWLPKDLAVGSVHLITRRDDVFIFPLRGLRGERIGSDRFRTTSEAQYEGEPLSIGLDLNLVKRGSDWARFAIGADVYAPRSDSRISFAGELQGTASAFRYDLSLEADYRDIRYLLQGFETAPDLSGALILHGRAKGDQQGFRLTDAGLELDNLPDYGLRASGTIDYRFGGQPEVQLDASAEIRQLEYLVDWTGLNLGYFGSAQGSMTIAGPLDALRVEPLILVAERDDGSRAVLSGTLSLAQPAEGGPAPDNAIRIDYSAPSLASLGLLDDPPALDPGHWRASALLTGNRARVTVSELLIQAGNPDTASLELLGSIDDISQVGAQGLGALRGLQATLAVQVPDIGRLASIGGPELPPYQAYSSTVRLSGDGHRYRVTDGAATLSSSDMLARVSNLEASIDLQAAAAVSGIRGEVALEASDTSAFSIYTTNPIPALGPIAGSAMLQQEDRRLALRDLSLSISDDKDLRIDATGHVADLLEADGISLSTGLAGLDTAQVLATVLDDFHYEASLGAIEGAFTFGYNGGRWSVDDLELSNRGHDGVLLSIKGQASDAGDHLVVNLRSGFNVRDTAFLKRLTGLQLSPVSGGLSSRAERNALQLRLSARAGATRVRGDASLLTDADGVAGLTLSLNSPSLLLSDLGLQAFGAGADEYRPAEAIDPLAEKRGLDYLLSHAPRYPTDLRLDFNDITGDNTRIRRFNLHVTGAEGQHTLRRLSARYNRAEAEVRGIIDLNQQAPYISLAGEAVEIPMMPLFDDLGIDFDIQGTLTLRGDLTAQGGSREALLASSRGRLSFALEDAVIKGAAFDVLATDLIDWIVSGAALKDSTTLDCTMALFNVDRGVATSDTLFVESKRMIATGEATLDLPRRRLDIRLLPHSKSRALQIPASIRIKGDMSDPQIIASPVAAMADATTEALLYVPRAILKLFGIRGRKPVAQPCVAGPG